MNSNKWLCALHFLLWRSCIGSRHCPILSKSPLVRHQSIGTSVALALLARDSLTLSRASGPVSRSNMQLTLATGLANAGRSGRWSGILASGRRALVLRRARRHLHCRAADQASVPDSLSVTSGRTQLRNLVHGSSPGKTPCRQPGMGPRNQPGSDCVTRSEQNRET
jgi:hypothetical protein